MGVEDGRLLLAGSPRHVRSRVLEVTSGSSACALQPRPLRIGVVGRVVPDHGRARLEAARLPDYDAGGGG
jgi:hypothetical protein